jgi:carboxyl-terminal processing protease
MLIRNKIPSITIWSLLFLFGALPIFAQAPMSECEARSLYETRNTEIQRLWREKKWDKAVPILQELVAMPAMMRIPEIRFDARYNLACGYSRLGQKEKSLALLREVVADTIVDPAQIEHDTDLENIRSEAAYKEILAAARPRWEAQKRFWDSPAMGSPFQANLIEDEKVAGLVRFWSEAKYNFAWFEKVPDLDWDAKMVEYLPRVRSTKSTLDYYRVMMEFAALLKDAHTNVSPPPQFRDDFESRPAIGLNLVEGRVLVTRVIGNDALTAAGVRRGVELIAVDDLPVREYASRFVMPRVTASTEQDRERRALVYDLLAGPRDSKVRLQFRDETGKTFEVSVTRLTSSELDKRDTTPPRGRFEFRTLDDGHIAYVGLNSFGEGAIVTDFEKAWPEIRKAPALILDVRRNGGGNSGYGSQILGYLVAKGGDVESARTRLYRPAYRAWGMGEDWHTDTWTVDAKPGAGYSGRTVVLTGPGTFSAAEDFAVSFDMLGAGIIIGEPTAGSTGQPLFFSLPGGGSARVCTLQCRYADGREFVGVGVQPKIRVSPTLADFRAGKDTVLEAAEAYLRGLASSKSGRSDDAGVERKPERSLPITRDRRRRGDLATGRRPIRDHSPLADKAGSTLENALVAPDGTAVRDVRVSSRAPANNLASASKVERSPSWR